MQQGHFLSIQTAACSCSQTGHIHTWSCNLLNASISSRRRLDFCPTYSHSKTTGIPSAKKIIIVLTGIRKTNRPIPKSSVPIPRVASHRSVILSKFKLRSTPTWYMESPPLTPLSLPFHYLCHTYLRKFFFFFFVTFLLPREFLSVVPPKFLLSLSHILYLLRQEPLLLR